MNFDKKVFKQRYGLMYNRLIIIQLIAIIISIVIVITKIPYLYFIACLIICFEIISLPFTYCFYIRIKKQSERQKQWIKDGKLYVEKTLDSGLTAGGFVTHKETIIFDHIYSICEKKRFFMVNGDIEIISVFNNVSKNKKVNSYKIPINFNNAEIIQNIGEY